MTLLLLHAMTVFVSWFLHQILNQLVQCHAQFVLSNDAWVSLQQSFGKLDDPYHYLLIDP